MFIYIYQIKIIIIPNIKITSIFILIVTFLWRRCNAMWLKVFVIIFCVSWMIVFNAAYMLHVFELNAIEINRMENIRLLDFPVISKKDRVLFFIYFFIVVVDFFFFSFTICMTAILQHKIWHCYRHCSLSENFS